MHQHSFFSTWYLGTKSRNYPIMLLIDYSFCTNIFTHHKLRHWLSVSRCSFGVPEINTLGSIKLDVLCFFVLEKARIWGIKNARGRNMRLLYVYVSKKCCNCCYKVKKLDKYNFFVIYVVTHIPLCWRLERKYWKKRR